MTRLATRLSLAAVLVALGAPFAPAWAQIETGRISGAVSDSQGGMVSTVTVTARSVNTGVDSHHRHRHGGNYVLANVNPDTYEVTFTKSGFKTEARRVVVSVGATAGADVKLEVGSVTEVVSVEAVPETIDVRTGEFRTTVSSRQLLELPTLTRNPYDLVALSGNVSRHPPRGAGWRRRGRGTGFSINGQRTASTNILLDGGDNNYLFTAAVGQDVPLDAVKEFSVITNNFSAQYGRASGGIVNVITKSGTNRFSGTATSSSATRSLPRTAPTTSPTTSRKGSSTAIRPATASAGRS